ncbi:MAG: helix-turn-helix domain-containing protein [Lachnospiraceae bacterium]
MRRNLLAKTNTPLCDIPLQCGFSSQNYFSYVFKKELGITPLQYRKKCQKN